MTRSLEQFGTRVVVGRGTDTQPVALSEDVRREHVLIVGASGSGKSTLLFHLARQLLWNGEGQIVIDPHGGFSRKCASTGCPSLQRFSGSIRRGKDE